MALAGVDQNVTTNSTVTLDGSASTAPDGSLVSYFWLIVSKPEGSQAALSSPTAVKPTFVPDRDGEYVIALVVTSGDEESVESLVTITAATGNSIPVASAGANQSVATGNLVTLDATASSDADGDSLIYAWSFISKPAGSAAVLSDAAAAKPTFTADVAGDYVLSLVVNDGTADSAGVTVTVTATDGNSAPAANAGTDKNVATGSTVTLDGSGSSDADGDPLTFSWSFVSKPDGSSATLSSTTAVKPTFVADVEGEYVLRLMVNDGFVNSQFDAVTVTGAEVTTIPTFTWGSTKTLSNIYRNADNPAVAIDEEGKVMAVWVENSTPSSVHAAYIEANSEDWELSGQIDGAVGNVPSYSWNGVYYSRTNPQVAMGGGKAFAVWIQHDGVNRSVYANRHDGSGWGNAVALESESDGDASYVRVVADAFGNATAVWVQNRSQSGEPTAILSARYFAANQSWSDPEAVAVEEALEDASAVQLALTPDGRIALVWMGRGETSSSHRLYYSVRSESGWGAPEIIAEGNIESTSFTFATDNNEPVVVWARIKEGISYYSVELGRRTGTTWAISNLTEDFDKSAHTPDIAATPEGGFIVAWTLGVGSAYYVDAYVRHYSNVGDWGAPLLRDSLGGTLPKLATDDYGRAVMIWQDWHTYRSNYTPEGGWSGYRQAFYYNSGRDHSVVMNGSGRAVVIATSTSPSPKKVQASLYR